MASHKKVSLASMSVTVNELSEIVRKYLLCRVKSLNCGSNILFIGPPGIGKSEGVIEAAKRVAEELGLEFWEYENYSEPPSGYDKVFAFVMFRLDMVKPEDLTGFPIPDKESKTFEYAIPRWVEALRKSKAGLVLLDEFTNVTDDVILSAAYDIVLNEKVNLYKFKKPVIALGNPPEFSSLARPLPLPLLNRLAVFNVKEPKVEEWCDYMAEKYGDSWLTEVCAFLHSRPDMILKPPEDVEDLQPFPTPRSWTALALALKNVHYDVWERVKKREKKALNKLLTVASAYVGREAASHFASWAYIDAPDLEEVLKNPQILLDMDRGKAYSQEALIFTLAQLANLTGDKWEEKVGEIAAFLIKNRAYRPAAMLLRLISDSRRRSKVFNYLRKKHPVILARLKSSVGGGKLFGLQD